MGLQGVGHDRTNSHSTAEAYTMLYWFQWYNIVVQYYTLLIDQRKSVTISKVITILLTIFLMLYITPLWHLFSNWKSVPLSLLYLFHPAPPALFLLATTSLFSGSMNMFGSCFIWLAICFLDSTFNWNHIVFVFFYMTYFT